MDLGDGNFLQPFHDGVIGGGVYVSHSEKVKIALRTGVSPRGKGFKVTFRTSNLTFDYDEIEITSCFKTFEQLLLSQNYKTLKLFFKAIICVIENVT